MQLIFPTLPDAACVDEDPNIFVADEFDKYPNVDQAKVICRRCPERDDCLAYALAHGEPNIWGGTTPKERSAMLRRDRIVTRLASYESSVQAKYSA